MKSFKLQKRTLTNSQLTENFEFNDKRELLQIVELSAEGLTVGAMKSALKVQAALSGVSDEGRVYLEDADHEWLKDKVENHRWRLIAPEIVHFVEGIKNAKEAEAPHLTQAVGA